MFLPWIVPKPKRIGKGGGEVIMNKFHAVIVFIIALLVGVIAYLGFYPDEARAFLLSVGGGIGQNIINVASSFNQSLATVEPYQVLAGGGIGGIVLTVFLANWLWPKIKHRRQIQPLVQPMQDRMAPSLPQPVTKTEESAK
jgi:hypothetical protein